MVIFFSFFSFDNYTYRTLVLQRERKIRTRRRIRRRELDLKKRGTGKSWRRNQRRKHGKGQSSKKKKKKKRNRRTMEHRGKWKNVRVSLSLIAKKNLPRLTIVKQWLKTSMNIRTVQVEVQWRASHHRTIIRVSIRTRVFLIYLFIFFPP